MHKDKKPDTLHQVCADHNNHTHAYDKEKERYGWPDDELAHAAINQKTELGQKYAWGENPVRSEHKFFHLLIWVFFDWKLLHSKHLLPYHERLQNVSCHSLMHDENFNRADLCNLKNHK